jgi:hypothetical protein
MPSSACATRALWAVGNEFIDRGLLQAFRRDLIEFARSSQPESLPQGLQHAPVRGA